MSKKKLLKQLFARLDSIEKQLLSDDANPDTWSYARIAKYADVPERTVRNWAANSPTFPARCKPIIGPDGLTCRAARYRAKDIRAWFEGHDQVDVA